MITSEVDSRDYIFAYLIDSEAVLPADFHVPLSDRDFIVGLFLPRDHPDWLGRSLYPPRILLLSHDAIVILTHPKYNAAPLRIPVLDLVSCEAGQIMLIGWLRFVTAESEIELPYNTRSQHPVCEFLNALMARYLPETSEPGRAEEAAFGPSLDIKFRNYLVAALQKDERVSVRFFRPPSEVFRRWGPLRLRSQEAGDLVAFTNRRVLWITDQWKGRYERYGGIHRTAPVHTLTEARCLRMEKDSSLVLSFISGASWRIPVPLTQREEASRFAASLRL